MPLLCFPSTIKRLVKGFIPEHQTQHLKVPEETSVLSGDIYKAHLS